MNVSKLRKNNSLIYLFIIILLVVAFWIGRTTSGPDLKPHIRKIFPQAAALEQIEGIYSVFSEQNELIGWAAAGSAFGYGGPLLVIAGIDTVGKITGAGVIEHKETPVFFRMVKTTDFFQSLTGRSFDEIDYDYRKVVGATGATRSAESVVEGIRRAVAKVAGDKFNVYVPVLERPLKFGFPEIAIIVLFALGIIAHHIGKSFREWLRWTGQITGLLIIGFWENSPVTIAKISAFLSGYFPDLHSDLYWYLLVGGFVLTILIYGKSVYCSHICPFGAAQRCIGVIGGANAKLPAWSVRLMNGLRNFFVFAAVTAALITAQPGSASYEPFAAIFALKGTLFQWFLLFIVLIASLVIKRPWCHFFCPMRTCERFLQAVRQKTINLWKLYEEKIR